MEFLKVNHSNLKNIYFVCYLDEIDNVFKIMAAVLFLGNLQFMEGKAVDEDSSDIVNKDILQRISKLLECDAKSLQQNLCFKKLVTVEGTLTVGLNQDQAKVTRDAFSMLLYSRLFDWLVKRINDSIQARQTFHSYIGVLDIYGFESFQVNSFEQFCINYANEKLQQQFNQQVFKLEQSEYQREEIDWSYIEFNENQECLDLIEKKPLCILSILGKRVILPRF